MFKVLILVCSMNLAQQDCDTRNATDVITAPTVSNEISCGLYGQALLASTAVVLGDRQYVKIQCQRPSSMEHHTDALKHDFSID